MTPLKLAKFAALFAIIQAGWLYVFLSYILNQIVGDWYIFWIVLGVVLLACIRRMGVMHYLEYYYTITICIFLRLIVDIALIYAVTDSFSLLAEPNYWWSYGVVLLAGGLFHKKKHIAVRRGEMKP